MPTRSPCLPSTLRIARLIVPHRIASCPSPFHPRPRAARDSPPTSSIKPRVRLPASHRRPRPRAPLSVSRVPLPVLSSRLSSIRLLLLTCHNLPFYLKDSDSYASSLLSIAPLSLSSSLFSSISLSPLDAISSDMIWSQTRRVFRAALGMAFASLLRIF